MGRRNYPSVQTLPYVTRAVPWYRRRWFRRGCWATFVVAAAAASLHWGPAAVMNVRSQLWQQRCLTYAVPAGTCVYDGLPDMSGTVPPQPSCLLNFTDVARLPRPVSAGTLLPRERTASDGTRQLVSVQVLGPRFQSMRSDICSIVAQTYSLGTLTTRPAQTQMAKGNCDLDTRPPGAIGPSHIRLFAGQPDPVDPSHFTIAFEGENGSGTIHGRLLGPDDIDFSVR